MPLEERRAGLWEKLREGMGAGLLIAKALRLPKNHAKNGPSQSEDTSCPTSGTSFGVAESPLSQRTWKEFPPFTPRDMGGSAFCPGRHTEAASLGSEWQSASGHKGTRASHRNRENAWLQSLKFGLRHPCDPWRGLPA